VLEFMRLLLSPVVGIMAFVAGVLLTIAYAALIGSPLSLPFGISGSPSASASASGGSSSASASLPGGTALPFASPGTDAPAVMVGAGDIADCDRFQDDATANAIARIEGTVFTLGDNVYPTGTTANFTKCYGGSWGRTGIKERTRPAAGGNEYKVPGAAAYFAYFGEAAGDPATGYYAYDEGAWRVYVLNSACREIGGCEAGSAQERWLRGDLVRHPARCVLAMWHVPVFSSGHGGDIGLMRPVWQALEDAGAELVLNGNQHSYERFAAQTATGTADDARGMVEIVAGTGGAQSSSFGAPAANSLVHASGVYGVVRLTLSSDSYRFEFISTGGPDFADSGSGTCH
jgi:acid phosphatase type 7